MVVERLTEAETITRYLLTSQQLAGELVTFAAFLPSIDWDPPVLSSQRVKGFNEAQLLEIGQQVAAEREMSLKGRADISVCDVRGNNLDAVLDEPPPGHVHLVGFPKPHPPFSATSKRQMAIEAWGEIATALARKAKLVRY
jgi:hypothetical protein